LEVTTGPKQEDHRADACGKAARAWWGHLESKGMTARCLGRDARLTGTR
jgi:hypothetical protein